MCKARCETIHILPVVLDDGKINEYRDQQEECSYMYNKRYQTVFLVFFNIVINFMNFVFIIYPIDKLIFPTYFIQNDIAYKISFL